MGESNFTINPQAYQMTARIMAAVAEFGPLQVFLATREDLDGELAFYNDIAAYLGVGQFPANTKLSGLVNKGSQAPQSTSGLRQDLVTRAGTFAQDAHTDALALLRNVFSAEMDGL